MSNWVHYNNILKRSQSIKEVIFNYNLPLFKITYMLLLLFKNGLRLIFTLVIYSYYGKNIQNSYIFKLLSVIVCIYILIIDTIFYLLKQKSKETTNNTKYSYHTI